MTTDLVESTQTIQDTDGTYYKKITVTGGTFGFLQNEQVTYKIEVEFSEDYNDSEYEGIIEYLELHIKSNQRMV